MTGSLEAAAAEAGSCSADTNDRDVEGQGTTTEAAALLLVEIIGLLVKTIRLLEHLVKKGLVGEEEVVPMLGQP